MDLILADYNSAENVIQQRFREEYEALERLLAQMPLHLKDSDQEGKSGEPIFNPVGTNSYIKEGLAKEQWKINLPIPAAFDFLGTNIDFFKNGLLCEVQFSNYPFLLNNLVRSELFYKSGIRFEGQKMEVAVIITKAHLFPASNSTLYYEQAKKQVDELARFHIFEIPIRLIGLSLKTGRTYSIMWTKYKAPRYSRTMSLQRERKVRIDAGAGPSSRAEIKYLRSGA